MYNDGEMYNVYLSDIFIDEGFNCRAKINPTEVFDLARSIEAEGQHQPVIVRTFQPDEQNFGKKLKLVAGFRRMAAIKTLSKDMIKAIVRTNLNNEDARWINLAENLNRKDLNLFEEAETLLKLHNTINPHTGDLYNEFEIGEKIGKSRGWVQTRLQLHRMPEPVQQLAREGFLNATGVRSLYGYENDEELATEVRRLKDQAHKNKQNPVYLKVKTRKQGKKNPVTIGKQRNKAAITKVIKYLIDQGLGDHSVLYGMAWCAGNTSDLEFLVEIQRLLAKEGVQYDIPETGLIDIIEEGMFEC